MLENHGKHLLSTLASLGLKDMDRRKAIENAENIIGQVVLSYEKIIGKGHVGKGIQGVPKKIAYTGTGVTGLIYGRIQSGKTRAMIVSTAIAFDNGFRVVVVMTSNINDLVSQTHFDFTKDLKGVTVFTKDDQLNEQEEDAKLELESPNGRILIVTSKGQGSLKNVTRFLKSIGAKKCPVLIFDDEGDQASLDTNNRKRSITQNPSLKKSPINELISTLRNELPASVYLSVTGTPQAVLLQSASSDIRPSFIYMLPPGAGYIGGDDFFDTVPPERNRHRLISIVPSMDKAQLLNATGPIPEGLKRSILFFLLSASAAIRKLGYPDKANDKDKGYQFLCHPSLKNTEQGVTAGRISKFLTEVKRVLMGKPDPSSIWPTIQNLYDELKLRFQEDSLPALKILRETMEDELRHKKILVINAQNTKRRGIEYGPGLNFLVGGNTLGRGIAIPNLLVTYYIRTSKTAQIDTMYQHARMFGYRMKTLPYTKLFITNDLYYRFRDIHCSDKELRNFIAQHLNENPDAFPVEISTGLRATRTGVLDVDNIETVRPGNQIYPNYIRLPQSPKVYKSVMDKVVGHLNSGIKTPSTQGSKGKIGTMISIRQAIDIVKLIKTKSENTWNDKTIASVIEKLGQRLEKRIKLRFRHANRTIEENGLLSSGTISGAEQNEGRAERMATLWIMSVTGSPDSVTGAGTIFAYPTIVVPNGLPKVFVFNKK